MMGHIRQLTLTGQPGVLAGTRANPWSNESLNPVRGHTIAAATERLARQLQQIGGLAR
jgi:hypothetical protein